MTNQLDAAIDFLKDACEGQDVYPETESFRAAIRVLEAAADFTPDDIERISNTIDDFIEYTPIANYKCPGRVLKDKFIAFLKSISALPEGPDK